MFGNQRIETIKKILTENKHVDVSYLSDVFGVSEVTIRRDLNRLEEEGFLVRSFGGASLRCDDGQNAPAGAGQADAPAQDDFGASEIGRLAAMQIKDNDVVFIGGGEECIALAAALDTDRQITVVTNSLSVAQAVAVRRGILVVFVGGMLAEDRDTFSGTSSVAELSSIVINRSFLSVDAVNLNRGYCVTAFENMMIQNYLKASVPDSYVLLSEKRIDQNTRFVLGNLGHFPNVITTDRLPQTYYNAFSENRVRVYTTISG